jgi:iron-sulfur cluster assembly accessory protein
MEHERQSEYPRQTAAPLLTLTDSAVEKLQQALAQADVHASGIRLTVVGGGCKGFQYSLTLAEAARPDDALVVQDGVTAFLDPVSTQHLRGTRLDYVSNQHGTGFHFFGLDAGRTIGCGSAIILRRCIAGNTRTVGCIRSSKRPLLDIGREVVDLDEHRRTSVAHPGLRPLSICPQCHYVSCRCE